MTKVCTKCGAEKDVLEFYVKDKATGRRSSKCKVCTSADGKIYYQNNVESIAETHGKWYEANKEKVFADVVRWQTYNPDKVRQYNRTCTANLR